MREALLKTSDGVPLGTLCVLDMKSRLGGLSSRESFVIETLARQVMAQMELRKALKEQEQLLAQQQMVQAELKRERDQSQRLLEGMDEGFIFLDEQFRLRQINPGGLRYELRTAQDMLGRSHWDVWPGSKELSLAQHYQRAMRERVPVSLGENYVFLDGRSFWLDIRAFPSDGGLAIFYRDITGRKLAENNSVKQPSG